MNQLCSRPEIESLLGMRIRTLSLYQEALLHKSAVKLYQATRSNERLEFIGDSVLNLIVANYLFENFPHENEGFMTKLRTRIVSGKCLANIAHKMQLHRHIRMNDKALKQKWNENPRILEDAFESLIGAIYLDMGLPCATNFIVALMQTYIDFDEVMIDTNYKDILMRYTQHQAVPLPEYTLQHEEGPNHDKWFQVSVSVSVEAQDRDPSDPEKSEKTNTLLGTGRAKNKKQAEQFAAQDALRKIQADFRPTDSVGQSTWSWPALFKETQPVF